MADVLPNHITEIRLMRDGGAKLSEIVTEFKSRGFRVSRQRIHQLLGNTGYLPDPRTADLRENVEQYRRSIALHDTSIQKLAAEIGVCQSTVKRIIGDLNAWQKRANIYRCSYCHKVKTKKEMRTDSKAALGVDAACKLCASDRATLNYRSRHRETLYKARYGEQACNVCGLSVSTSAVAWRHHSDAHKTRGEAVPEMTEYHRVFLTKQLKTQAKIAEIERMLDSDSSQKAVRFLLKQRGMHPSDVARLYRLAVKVRQLRKAGLAPAREAP